MHFLNRIGAIILLICVAGITHLATLYVIYGSVPAAYSWIVYPLAVIIGLFMWLKDWHNYNIFTFKWHDKENRY